MPISLAGVELLTPSKALCSWVERTIPVGEAFPWLQPSAGFPSLDTTTLGVPGYRMPTTFRVNEFVWPQGASRWAYGAFLASADQAEQVRAAANGKGGSTSTPIVLTLATPGQPSGEALQVSLTLLRVVPMTQFVATNNGTPTALDDFAPNNIMLLVVVDARYFWQHTGCPDFGIMPYGSSNPLSVSDPNSPNYGGTVPVPVRWRICFKKCEAALGATINVDPIPNAYLFPDPAFNLAGMPIGPVLDALCANTGLRFVANYDGTFAAQSVTYATAARQTDDTSATGQARSLRAGGDGFADVL